MIILNVKQGSEAWLEARCGIATASNFGSIVTRTGKLSASRDGYLAKLVAEYFGGPGDYFESDWMERGKMLEAEAFDYYALVEKALPERVGFVYRDEGRMCGASPDGLVGDKGLLELKCPSLETHLQYLARDVCPRDYFAQVQGQIWCSNGEREWCDFMSYYPGMPSLIVRVEPDVGYQAALSKYMPLFVKEILAHRERLIEIGVPEPEFEELEARRERLSDREVFV